jgi:hypothetical protein
MQVPALKDGGGTELRWRLTFLFVILEQPCGAKGEYLSRNAQRSLKSSSEQLEYWQLHAQTLPIWWPFGESFDVFKNERGTDSEEPLVGKPASTSGRIDAVKIYRPCISFTLFFRGSFYLDNYKMSSLMNVSQFSLL